MYGWKWKLPSYVWHRHCIDKYPEWELEDGETPAFVKLAHTRGGEGSDVESHKLASDWDDVAKDSFYQRDWTKTGIPFVEEGGTYWSEWWFATIKERDRFLAWRKENALG